MAAICTGISAWRKKETPAQPAGLPRSLRSAFHHQTRIGWRAACRGFFSHKWREAQNDHFERIGSKRTGL
eukprot:5684689-Ditylum_brightwellii.AAC.1